MSINISRKYNKSITGKVILAFVLGCITILVSWGITKLTFRQMLTTVNKLATPDPKLGVVNQIFREVVKLDQLQREQILKINDKPYNPFFRESAHLQALLDTLRAKSADNPVQLQRIDTMKNILLERDKLFISYMRLRSDFSRNDTLSERIRSLSGLITSSNANKDNIIATERKITTTIVRPDSSVALEQPSRPSLWEWIWGRRRGPDSVKLQKLVTEELNITTDTLTSLKDDTLLQNLDEVVGNMELLRESQRNKLVNRQLQLIRAGNILISQLSTILHDIETQEMLSAEQNTLHVTGAVNAGIKKINLLLILFILGASVMVFFIFNDIFRINAYRKELMAAKEDAEETGRVKQRFLSNMSHEIRTPLQTIIGFSEQLKKKGKAAPEDLDIIYHSSQHLLQIVNEVLDYSRIVSGRYTIDSKAFNMYRLLNEVKEMVQVTAQEKQLEFIYDVRIDAAADYWGDPFRLKQILLNLLGNAAKFTERGSIGLIVTQKEFRNRVSFTFEVRDTGVGISAYDQERIFREFEQGASKQQQEGTGLGLSIVKELIEAQRGTISVTSTLGKGTELKVKLSYPALKEDEQRTVAGREEIVKESYGGTVWVVDDDLYILHLCDSILSKHGIRHQCFSSTDEVLNTTPPPDLGKVFIDIRMPSMTGFELCERLRKKVQAKFIALTAQALPDERAAILIQGFDDLLMKPFLEQELINMTGSGEGTRVFAVPDALRQMTGDDPVALRSIVQSFIKETGNDLAILSGRVEAGDLMMVAEQLHKLAGRCGQFGIRNLSLRLRRAEIAIRNEGHWDTVRPEVEQLCHELQQMISTIQSDGILT